MANKYDDFKRHLARVADSPWRADFSEIEKVLGFPLPRSAYEYPAWWANQKGSGHTQSHAWQSAGWRTEDLDVSGRRVTFCRVEEEDRARERNGDDRILNVTAPLTIAQAKAGLAAHFGVSADSVEITIKG